MTFSKNKFGYILGTSYLCIVKSIRKLIIEVEYYDDPDLPEKYLASFKDDSIKRCAVEAAASLPEVLRELAISIEVLEHYDKIPLLER